MRNAIAGIACAALCALVAWAEPYWVAYEADDGLFPEEVGWTRHTLSGGDQRSLADGRLLLDSLGGTMLEDFYKLDGWTVPVAAGETHTYHLESGDMVTYSLWIDGSYVRDGAWQGYAVQSFAYFGDASYGSFAAARSLMERDYFRFGAVAQARVGDVNCDGEINAFDIDPFVLVLTDPGEYEVLGCDPMLADINGDGVVDVFDIDPFVELLVGGKEISR